LAEARGHRDERGALDFWRHVEDFRRMLLWSVLGWSAGALVAWNWWTDLWNVLLQPLSGMEHPPRIVALTPMASVTTSVQIALVAGSLVAAPWVFWQVWRFVAPALVPAEKRGAAWIAAWGALLFAVGVATGFVTVLPMTLRWLATYGDGLFEQMWSVEAYTTMCVKMLGGFGAMFEFPLATWALARVGVVTASKLLRWSRGAIVAIFVVAAVLTPPDPVSQIILAVPMVALYFAGVATARLAESRRTP
jgi:sec-independent protein translocase protein TatC